jgi:hypothetical protein
MDETGGTLEVLMPSAVEALNKSEIESQIEVAKRYPRSMHHFKEAAVAIATLDEDTAAACIYRRPVGREGGQQKFAEGMSIRMAEIVGACYGNLRVYATLLSQTERQVVARGMAIDLQNNFASSSEVVEVTVTQDGRPYSERQRAVIAKAAMAKARRDATFQVVPKALAKPIEQAVRKLLSGDQKSLEQRRQSVYAWIKTLGIDEKRVWDALGVGGVEDVGLKELEDLTGVRTAIKDNEVTIDEAFPRPESKESPKRKSESAEPAGNGDLPPQAAGVDDKQPGAGAAPPEGGKRKNKADKQAAELEERLAKLRELIEGPIEVIRDTEHAMFIELCRGLAGKEFEALLVRYNERRKEL